MTEEMIGRTVGRYRIDERLGQGGTGVVYRAQDLRLGRTVALKLLNQELHDVPAAWGQLLAEARTASSLNHPNICTVYEAGEEDGVGYISMEYVQGQTLTAAAMPRGLPPETVADYGAQIAEALEHAHEQGIIHGDVKSANVMITPKGRIKVLDFGLARPLAAEDLSIATESRASLNEIGSIAGTLPYLAPEILRGRPATTGTDLWGAGVILYEISTGELPFKGNTPFELSLDIMVDSRVSISRVPSRLRPVVGKCLDKDSARRYQTARGLRDDLRKRPVAPQAFQIISPRRHGRLRPASVTVSQATLSGTGFTLKAPALPLTLTAGQSLSLTIGFSPANTRSASGTVSVSSASDSPLIVAFSGTGQTYQLTASPSSLGFGEVTVGENAILPSVPTSTGTGEVTISQVAASGSAFTVANPGLPLVLASGRSTSVTLTFAPTVGGSATGTLTVTSTATGSPFTEALSGTGTHVVDLGWTASSSSGVTGYNVYRSSRSDGQFNLISLSPVIGTSFVDTDVTAGQTYYYKTTAVGPGGVESDYSNLASATIPLP